MFERLLDLELELIDSTTAPSFGDDPYRIMDAPRSGEFLVLMRGSSEMVLLDSSFEDIARVNTPPSPAGWEEVDSGIIVVGGELSNELGFYRVGSGNISELGKLSLPGVVSIREVEFLPDDRTIFLTDPWRDMLVRIKLPADWSRRIRNGNISDLALEISEYQIGAEPIDLEYSNGYLAVNLLLDHKLLLLPTQHGIPDITGATAIAHAGPMWGFDIAPDGEGLRIAIGGVEDRPLDRTGGEFGWVDSFVFLYSFQQPGTEPGLIASKNVSELGMITPKVVRFRDRNVPTSTIFAAGFGSGVITELERTGETFEPVESRNVPPGTTDFTFGEGGLTGLTLANTLVDAIYSLSPSTHSADMTPSYRPSSTTRNPLNFLGEMLIFTELMAPNNVSDSVLSRFTCETCHFEGGIDGRTHYTGREQIFATTKPVQGLANNVPLFSRGGDETMASMTLAEFKAANQGDGTELFSLQTHDYPWLAHFVELPDSIGPEMLRRAFLSYLASYSRPYHPLRADSTPLTEGARAAIETFRQRCGFCHQPLFTTSNRFEGVEHEEWPTWLESEQNDLVWGAPHFSKTGIEPYVSPRGTRVTSLRRVTQKYPYFTNGSSQTLRDVLERFRYNGSDSWHHVPPADMTNAHRRLERDEINNLLDLLEFF